MSRNVAGKTLAVFVMLVSALSLGLVAVAVVGSVAGLIRQAWPHASPLSLGRVIGYGMVVVAILTVIEIPVFLRISRPMNNTSSSMKAGLLVHTILSALVGLATALAL
ncbi:MAG: hypothetical protein A2754_01225 [Candidatus Magasanikbacteria bacterium RIFCSPHIGHO2_01_FULL_47_8]|uniref:Uncharacterized protein n=1 Tax=Candidatus Magasanikbacteria bacterium RIFCSPHIGHO2_01_FULL_47_8 TaxID=1798673 RepID=A0A1F6MCJ1_9BACT|nr:MAG: hypothetical protein A2754_01225 [Candidatus Magasanikbacteria bacterium RIFCSPHIGHO2_01_FULL_47_8]